MGSSPAVRRAGTWRVAQICIYLSAVGCSIGTLIGYKGLNQVFGQDISQCVLYSTLRITPDEKGQCPLNIVSADHTCNFVYFTVMASIIYAIIGCWFFIACTSEAKTRPDETVIQSWKLVVPSTFFSFVMWVLVTISSSWITNGFTNFYTQFKAQSAGCSKLDVVTGDITTYSSVSQTFTWLTSSVWLIATLILLCRCCVAADFITHSEPEESLSRQGTLLKKAIPKTPSAVWYRDETDEVLSNATYPGGKLKRKTINPLGQMIRNVPDAIKRRLSATEFELPEVRFYKRSSMVMLDEDDQDFESAVSLLPESRYESATSVAVKETAFIDLSEETHAESDDEGLVLGRSEGTSSRRSEHQRKISDPGPLIDLEDPKS